LLEIPNPIILTLNEAKDKINNERNLGKKIVMTNGCFDLLHIGHISSLKYAKKQGDILIVAVNDDDSVRKLKGQPRPIIPLQYRLEMLSELKVVDYVISFSEQNALSIINLLKPDIYVKGADYNLLETPEGINVLNYGGKVLCSPLVPGVSTTSIINRIYNSFI
jgi:D-beta-D-heptose 7-phosphate kinase/D-beta-D-heptose 1-phosphate adenosyltransferase